MTKSKLVLPWTDSITMNGSTNETDSVESLRQRISEMENLLHANRMLCNILDPIELYSTIAGLVREQLKVSTLCVFVYHHDIEKFESVYSHGLNDLVFTFNKNDGPLWEKILCKRLPFYPYHRNIHAAKRIPYEFELSFFLMPYKNHPNFQT